MTILISAMVFTGTLLLLLAGYYFTEIPAGTLGGRREGTLGRHRRQARAGCGGGGRRAGNSVKSLLFGISARAGRRFQREADETHSSRFRKLLLTAGVRHQGAPAVFWGAKILCARPRSPVLAFFGYIVAERALIDVEILLVLGIAALAGFYFPICASTCGSAGARSRSFWGSPTRSICSSSASRRAWGSMRPSTAWPRRSG